MTAVLHAFATLAIVIAVGFVVGRAGVLGDGARMVLTRVAFHIGVPALVLLALAASEPRQVLSRPLLASAIAALLAFGLCFALVAGLRGRGRGEATVAAWTGCYTNAGNLGIPLASYVFGSTAEISAIIVFQIVVLVPLGMAILDSATAARRSLRRRVATIARNPIIVAAVIGMTVAVTGVELPSLVTEPLDMLGSLAIPTVLLAFGISLALRSSDDERTDRTDLAVVVAVKVLVMPALAFAVARFGLRADPAAVLVVTTFAALPSAQNVNTYAALYGRGQALARDATLVSTVLSVPVIVAVVAVLGVASPAR